MPHVIKWSLGRFKPFYLLEINSGGVSSQSVRFRYGIYFPEGANTRLGARRIDDDVHSRVVEEFKNLQTQVDQWMLLISSGRQTDKDDIGHIANNFIARINNLA